MGNVIKDLIKKCDITNFDDSSELEIRKYISDYLNSHIPPVELDAKEKMYSKFILESNNVSENTIIQEYVCYVEQCKNIFKIIGDKYIFGKKYQGFTDALIHIFLNSFLLLTSINSLLISKCNQSVVIEWRTLYENYLILMFLEKHRELSEAFNDHFDMCRLVLEQELANLKNEELEDQYKKQLEDLKNKYDKSFSDDYGWAYSVIGTGRKGCLEKMYDDCNINKAFRLLYIESCKFTHSTAYSVFFKPDFKYIERFLYASVEILKDEFNILFSELPMPNNYRELLKYTVIILSDTLLCKMDATS